MKMTVFSCHKAKVKMITLWTVVPLVRAITKKFPRLVKQYVQ